MSVNIGVVGLGIGAVHVDSLSRIPDAKLVAFADMDEARVQQFAEKHGAHAYTDWNAMLENESELDAVILATPARLRLEPIRAICERKLALFCEKPPAMNLQEALQIRDIIESANILNAVGFMYRWSPLAFKMRELIAGKPCLFARSMVAWPVFDWVMNGKAPKNLLQKSGCGGPLIEQAIHYQDVLRYVTGDEPVAVQAMAELGNSISRENRDCQETTAYLLRHESGMLSSHVHNWSHKGTLMEIQVAGSNYHLTWNMAGNTMRLTGRWENKEIDETCESQCYFQEMEGFVQAVKNHDQNFIRSSYSDACRTLSVCAAGEKAVTSACTVSIPL